MLTREKLVNISIFMRLAVESGSVKSVNDAMAFAETLTAVNAEIEAIDKKNPPKIPEAVKKAVKGAA